RLNSGGGPHKEQRRQAAAREYVAETYRFEEKLFAAIQALPPPQSLAEMVQRASLEYFHDLLIKQLDLVERRWLREEKIPQAEQEREDKPSFRKLRYRHHAVESDINCLEHHGLNRCPDKGLHGYKRYVGLGVLAYNLHKIGNELLHKRRAETEMRSLSA